MKLVLVEWVDSHSARGWQSLEELKANAVPLHCRTVGGLVTQTKEGVMLTAGLAGEKNGSTEIDGAGHYYIPRGCIRKLTVLRKS